MEPRDAARLLVDRGAGASPDHRHVRDLPELLEPGDLVVVNDSRVIPARLRLHRPGATLPERLEPGDVVVVNDSRVIPARLRLHRHSGGAVEVLLLEALDADHRRWECLVRPARRLARGEELVDDQGRAVLVMGSRTEAGDTLTVELCAADPLAAI